MNSAVLIVLVSLVGTQGRIGFGPYEQDWGFVTVRKDAHMFWWLYFTTANVQNYTERPLIAWLQGGPGVSSTGYGNFAELGPLDLDLNERNYTWVKDANVLFVDNPVGTGFSYVDHPNVLTKTNREIAVDFVELLSGFYKEHPEFVTVPFYIFSESYGGKMTAEIALVLDQAIKKGSIKSNFLGVGLGDSWIDPMNTVLEWAPYLFAVGVVDQTGHDAIAAAAEETKKYFDRGLYSQATDQWEIVEKTIATYSANTSFYNILKPISAHPVRNEEDYRVNKIIPQVQKALRLNNYWESYSYHVKVALDEDFMKPVTLIVEELLNTTNIKIAVYNGQLDLIVCTPGTLKWVDNLKWSLSDKWAAADRPAFKVDGIYEGFEKETGNLALYWVNRAGHMVPADNPAAMDYILRKLTRDYDGTLQRQ